MVATQDGVQQHVDQVIVALSKKYDFDDYTHHFAKIGRQYDLEINILVKDDYKQSAKRQDYIRQQIWDQLSDELGDTWLSVSFTG